MILIELEFTCYKYKVEVPLGNRAPLREVTDWATALDIKCALVPGAGYFANYDDAMLFILRWS